MQPCRKPLQQAPIAVQQTPVQQTPVQQVPPQPWSKLLRVHGTLAWSRGGEASVAMLKQRCIVPCEGRSVCGEGGRV